jgi:hypothetical protein
MNRNISDEDLKKLVRAKSFSHLRQINLSLCPQISAKGLNYLKELPFLEQLTLVGNCQLVSADLEKHLRECPRLQSIDLRFCHMDQKDLEQLGKRYKVLIDDLS